MDSDTRGMVRILVLVVSCLFLVLGLTMPAVAAGPGVATVATGDNHACAVRTDGTVWCWGLAQVGQLGDGTTGDPVDHIRTTPVRVRLGAGALRDATKVDAGANHSCAVRSGGGVVCWGYNGFGQLGNGRSGTPESRTSAVRVRRASGYLTGVERVAAGERHTCALRRDGGVMCWGDGSLGQLGDGRSGAGHLRTEAVRVHRGDGYLTGVVAIAAGYRHTCAVRRDGSAWCWGDDTVGQLGDGRSGADRLRTKATRVLRGGSYLTRVSGIATGGYHTCARRADGSAWCWGWEKYGAIGDGVASPSIVRTKAVRVRRGSGALTYVTGIAAGVAHSCARRGDGSAVCWGSDVSGQLGDGTTGDAFYHRTTAVRVVRTTGPFTHVRKLDGGSDHTCALRTDRSVWCWGYDGFGQLGRGSSDTDPHPFPGKVLFP